MDQILVVDDDPVQRDLLRAVLEDEGYRVREAADGTAALDLLRQNAERFVVLLDYHMPSAGGKHLLQLVSQDAALSTRHGYILLTALRQISLPVEVVSRLAVPFLYKPFELSDLLAIVVEAQQRLAADRAVGQ